MAGGLEQLLCCKRKPTPRRYNNANCIITDDKFFIIIILLQILDIFFIYMAIMKKVVSVGTVAPPSSTKTNQMLWFEYSLKFESNRRGDLYFITCHRIRRTILGFSSLTYFHFFLALLKKLCQENLEKKNLQRYFHKIIYSKHSSLKNIMFETLILDYLFCQSLFKLKFFSIRDSNVSVRLLNYY